MTPRRLPHSPAMITLHRGLPCHPRMRVASVAWTRKTFALAIHMTCLGLFGLTVVWPVASPMASGELAREFKPVLEALAALAR